MGGARPLTWAEPSAGATFPAPAWGSEAARPSPHPPLCHPGGPPALVLYRCGSAGQATLFPPWAPWEGLPSLGRGLRWVWEQRGLALSPQRRGEDLPADQLHDQRLPWRVHPHRVSRRAGPELARGGYGRLCAGLPWASRSGPSSPGLGSGVRRGADRAPGLCRPENPDTGGISLTLFPAVLTTILRM